MTMRKSLVNTGFSDLDRKINGLCGADLMVLAARPSMGKTALALNIVANIVLAKKPKPVLFISLELNRYGIMNRLIGSEAEVDLKNICTGFFHRTRWGDITDAASRFCEAPLYINDAEKIEASDPREVVHETIDRMEKLHHGSVERDIWKVAKHSPCMTVPFIRTISRRLMTQFHKKYEKLGVIVIDSVQLMRGVPRGKIRRHELSRISRSLKHLARDLNVPVIVLSRVGQSAEENGRADYRPRISDLHEFGALGEDADILAFIYRDEYYHPDKLSSAGRAEIIVAKNPRGQTGTLKMKFNRELGSFY